MTATARARLRRATIAAALALVAITAPLYAVKVYLKTDYMDSDVYLRAAQRLREGDWQHLYAWSATERSPFRYSPATLPVLAPLEPLSRTQGKLLWYFLQYASFAAGFIFLRRALRRLRLSREAANWATALATLFVLRFCLDNFTIGQVSGLVFAGLALSFDEWIRRRPGRAALALFVPTAFKLGTGALYGLLLTGPSRLRGFSARALAGLLALTAALSAAVALWAGSRAHIGALWSAWGDVVRHDGDYFDASRLGSQSIHSALLRLANHHWIGHGDAVNAWIIFSILGCAALAAFWIARVPRGARGRAQFFALGVFPYLWFMPEAFKNAYVVLAIPVALMAARMIEGASDRADRTVFAAGALVLSLAGMDVVGETLFFGSQKLALPLFCTFALAAITLREAWRESRPRFDAPVRTRAPRITADDWGLSPAVNAGVLELARLGVVRRVSVLANATYLNEGLAELTVIPGLEIGLHFNLTHGLPRTTCRTLVQGGGPGLGSFHPPFVFFRRWITGRIDPNDVRRSFLAQITRLKEAGIRPSYLDAHHHVHLVPGVLDAIAPFARAEGIERVRIPYDPGLWLTKHAPLCLASWIARRSLRRHGFRSRPCFYPRGRHFADIRLLSATFARKPGYEVIVHPAIEDDLARVRYTDSYRAGRVAEYLALRSWAEQVPPCSPLPPG